jgi:hypothetical protein
MLYYLPPLVSSQPKCGADGLTSIADNTSNQNIRYGFPGGLAVQDNSTRWPAVWHLTAQNGSL